jgi:hypothetical protein
VRDAAKGCSDSGFPPHASHPAEIAVVLEGFANVIERRTATYVSSPLTTGQTAAEWHLRNGGRRIADDEDFRRNVIEPNRTAAAAYVRDLRKARGVVIDPTAMGDLPGWTQPDYRYFWGRVIELYANEVVFRDGWQHSSGCAYEFFVALQSGASTLREDLTPLSLENGQELVRAAVEECETRGVSAEFLYGVVEALGELAAAR